MRNPGTSPDSSPPRHSPAPLRALAGGTLLLTSLLGARLALAAGMQAAQPALFAASAPQALPSAAGGALPSAAGGALRVIIALVVVLLAVFAAAWLSRRMHGAGGARHSGLEVLAQLPLGPRERAVLVRVGAQQLLLGVTNGSVRTLHVLDAATPVSGAALPAGGSMADESRRLGEPPSPPRPSFKALLLRSLGK